MNFKIGDKVRLPLEETGTIIRVNAQTLDWFPYKVRIRKGVFNKTNQITEFRLEDLRPETTNQ